MLWLSLSSVQNTTGKIQHNVRHRLDPGSAGLLCSDFPFLLLAIAAKLEKEIGLSSGARFRGVTVNRSTNPYYQGMMHLNCYDGTLAGSLSLIACRKTLLLPACCPSPHMSAHAGCSAHATPVKETMCLNFSLDHSNGSLNA